MEQKYYVNIQLIPGKEKHKLDVTELIKSDSQILMEDLEILIRKIFGFQSSSQFRLNFLPQKHSPNYVIQQPHKNDYLKNILMTNKANIYIQIKQTNVQQKLQQIQEAQIIQDKQNQKNIKIIQEILCQNLKLEKQQIDMIILYSQPLSSLEHTRTKKDVYVDYKSVNFYNEKNSIVKIIKNSIVKKNISLYITCLRKNFLLKAIDENPKILHFMCHGGLDENGDYYLEFEADKAYMEKYKIDYVKDLLAYKKHNIKLVFINACYSQKISQFFLDFGVQCVISIQSDTKIIDDIAICFSQEFYSNLLNGQSIIDSFKQSLVQVQNVFVDRKWCLLACCCSHSHNKDCKLKKHAQHTPKGCDCDYKNYLLHETDCEVMYDFLTNNNFAQYCDNEYKIGEKNYRQICCGCTQLQNHNQVEKFKIQFKDNNEEHGKQVIFDERSSTENNNVQIVNTVGDYEFYNCCHLIGQNQNLFQMYQLAVYDNPQTLVIISGEKSTGKTSLALSFLNYCLERKNFECYIYIDCKHDQSFDKFKKNFDKEYDLLQRQKRRNVDKILLIFDNIEILVKYQKQQFELFLTRIQDKQNGLIILIAELLDTQRIQLQNFDIVEIHLGIELISQIFIQKIKPTIKGKYIKSTRQLQEDKLFKEIYTMVKIPTQQDVRNLFKKDLYFIRNYYKLNQTKEQSKNVFIIQNEFLFFLNFFPYGIDFDLELVFYIENKNDLEKKQLINFFQKELTLTHKNQILISQEQKGEDDNIVAYLKNLQVEILQNDEELIETTSLIIKKEVNAQDNIKILIFLKKMHKISFYSQFAHTTSFYLIFRQIIQIMNQDLCKIYFEFKIIQNFQLDKIYNYNLYDKDIVENIDILTFQKNFYKEHDQKFQQILSNIQFIVTQQKILQFILKKMETENDDLFFNEFKQFFDLLCCLIYKEIRIQDEFNDNVQNQIAILNESFQNLQKIFFNFKWKAELVSFIYHLKIIKTYSQLKNNEYKYDEQFFYDAKDVLTKIQQSSENSLIVNKQKEIFRVLILKLSYMILKIIKIQVSKQKQFPQEDIEQIIQLVRIQLYNTMDECLDKLKIKIIYQIVYLQIRQQQKISHKDIHVLQQKIHTNQKYVDLFQQLNIQFYRFSFLGCQPIYTKKAYQKQNFLDIEKNYFFQKQLTQVCKDNEQIRFSFNLLTEKNIIEKIQNSEFLVLFLENQQDNQYIITIDDNLKKIQIPKQFLYDCFQPKNGSKVKVLLIISKSKNFIEFEELIKNINIIIHIKKEKTNETINIFNDLMQVFVQFFFSNNKESEYQNQSNNNDIILNSDLLKQIWTQVKQYKNYNLITKLVQYGFESQVSVKRYPCIKFMPKEKPISFLQSIENNGFFEVKIINKNQYQKIKKLITNYQFLNLYNISYQSDLVITIFIFLKSLRKYEDMFYFDLQQLNIDDFKKLFVKALESSVKIMNQTYSHNYIYKTVIIIDRFNARIKMQVMELIDKYLKYIQENTIQLVFISSFQIQQKLQSLNGQESHIKNQNIKQVDLQNKKVFSRRKKQAQFNQLFIKLFFKLKNFFIIFMAKIRKHNKISKVNKSNSFMQLKKQFKLKFKMKETNFKNYEFYYVYKKDRIVLKNNKDYKNILEYHKEMNRNYVDLQFLIQNKKHEKKQTNMQQYKSYIENILQDPLFKYIDDFENNIILCKDCYFDQKNHQNVLNQDDSFTSEHICKSCNGKGYKDIDNNWRMVYYLIDLQIKQVLLEKNQKMFQIIWQVINNISNIEPIKPAKYTPGQGLWSQQNSNNLNEKIPILFDTYLKNKKNNVQSSQHNTFYPTTYKIQNPNININHFYTHKRVNIIILKSFMKKNKDHLYINMVIDLKNNKRLPKKEKFCIIELRNGQAIQSVQIDQDFRNNQKRFIEQKMKIKEEYRLQDLRDFEFQFRCIEKRKNYIYETEPFTIPLLKDPGEKQQINQFKFYFYSNNNIFISIFYNQQKNKQNLFKKKF